MGTFMDIFMGTLVIMGWDNLDFSIMMAGFMGISLIITYYNP